MRLQIGYQLLPDEFGVANWCNKWYSYYMRTEYKKIDPKIRFEAKIEKTSTCWIWHGTLHANGYGLFGIRINKISKKIWAHRYSFELYKRPLLPGDTVDHLCFNPQCVNPDHLEAVSIGENSRRSPRTLTGQNIRKTHCPKGHSYSGNNLYYDQGKRKCRECVRARNRLADARRRREQKSIVSQ